MVAFMQGAEACAGDIASRPAAKYSWRVGHFRFMIYDFRLQNFWVQFISKGEAF
jgi:hypothetical protein